MEKTKKKHEQKEQKTHILRLLPYLPYPQRLWNLFFSIFFVVFLRRRKILRLMFFVFLEENKQYSNPSTFGFVFVVFLFFKLVWHRTSGFLLMSRYFLPQLGFHLPLQCMHCCSFAVLPNKSTFAYVSPSIQPNPTTKLEAPMKRYTKGQLNRVKN